MGLDIDNVLQHRRLCKIIRILTFLGLSVILILKGFLISLMTKVLRVKLSEMKVLLNYLNHETSCPKITKIKYSSGLDWVGLPKVAR